MPNSPCLLILFLYLLAVTLTPVLTCYPCFAKSSEKFCTDYVGQSPAEIKTARCWYPIKRLMKERPIYWVRVVAADYKELKSIYSKALKLIKKRRREVPQESYTSLLDHVEQEVLYKVYNLKEGINKAATYFDCRLCRLHDCNGIRFDCPIEDVRIKETGHVSMKCEASFPIPEISSVTWWFVRSIRSDVIQQFMVLHVGSEDTLTINNVNMRNSGSFACDVTVHGTILLRRFFYLTGVCTDGQHKSANSGSGHRGEHGDPGPCGPAAGSLAGSDRADLHLGHRPDQVEQNNNQDLGPDWAEQITSQNPGQIGWSRTPARTGSTDRVAPIYRQDPGPDHAELSTSWDPDQVEQTDILDPNHIRQNGPSTGTRAGSGGADCQPGLGSGSDSAE
ncbi:sperm acrosome membrane-associated protein 6 isoform X2 [Narcine bancroftii]|uniref:sperm acrosome membrane-associated protein 6 isoform X2 n=1 Tax=Narcine bancroftii TaxID=1343680 RepID=UPI0038315CDA